LDGLKLLLAHHAEIIMEDSYRPIGIDRDMQGFGKVHVVPGTLADGPEVLYKY